MKKHRRSQYQLGKRGINEYSSKWKTFNRIVNEYLFLGLLKTNLLNVQEPYNFVIREVWIL